MKSRATLELEKKIYAATAKRGVFGCFEVTIGWYGKERVDYMTYDTAGIIRCYELKTSVSDFHSQCHNSFVGHYNYYVLTNEVYKAVANEIPDGIGVYVGDMLMIKAKKRECVYPEEELKSYLIRSLSREAQKVYKNSDENSFICLQKEKTEALRAKDRAEGEYDDLLLFIYEKFGWMWQNEFSDWRYKLTKAKRNHLRDNIRSKMADTRRKLHEDKKLSEQERRDLSSNCVYCFKKY